MIALPPFKRYGLPLVASILLVLAVDALTNNVTEKLLFDSNLYIGIAEHGFAREYLVAPFIYRYATPVLAGAVHRWAGLSIYKTFKAIAYLGGFGQLFGTFLLVERLAGSQKGGFAGMAAVALSMYNLKYLLFDVYRPDTLAFALVLVVAWFALQNNFFPLLLTTVIGAQFREFAVIPLLAYTTTRLCLTGIKQNVKVIIFSLAGLLLAVVLPRAMIPVIDNVQDVNFSRAGLSQLVYLLSLWPRNYNILFVVFAYFLPILILVWPVQFKDAIQPLDREKKLFLSWYAGFTFILLVAGGTDLARFAAYFFLPLAILFGLFAKNVSVFRLLSVFGIQALFNRIWLPFPVWEFDLMVDFYSGWSNLVNEATFWRSLEVVLWAVAGSFLVHVGRKKQTVPEK